MARMGELEKLAADLDRALQDMEPMQHVVGGAGKKAAQYEMRRATGGDMRLSGMRRKVRLGVGYDTGNPVVLNLRPVGLVILAHEGRKRTQTIVPRKRGGKQALKMRAGVVRAASRSTPSKGKNLISRTMRRAGDEATKALDAEMASFIQRRI